jgi:hypothetical protein
VVLLAALGLAGCSGDDQTDFGSGTDTPNTPQATNAPTSLSGRSYTFTVTANQSFSDEFNSGYVIDFQSETAYLLHPSPQNLRPLPDEQGNYSYDRRSGLVQLVSVTPVNGILVEMLMNFLSPTTGAAHLTGPNGASQDAVFIQTSP